MQEQLGVHLRAECAASWRVFLWLVEEWCLARSLLSRAGVQADDPAAEEGGEAATGGGEGAGGAAGALRLQLCAPEAVWRDAIPCHVAADVAAGVAEGGAEDDEPHVAQDLRAMGEEAADCPDAEEARWRVELVILDGAGADTCLACT